MSFNFGLIIPFFLLIILVTIVWVVTLFIALLFDFFLMVQISKTKWMWEFWDRQISKDSFWSQWLVLFLWRMLLRFLYSNSLLLRSILFCFRWLSILFFLRVFITRLWLFYCIFAYVLLAFMGFQRSIFLKRFILLFLFWLLTLLHCLCSS